MFVCLEELDRTSIENKSEVKDLYAASTSTQDYTTVPHKQSWYHMVLASFSCIVIKVFSKVRNIIFHFPYNKYLFVCLAAWNVASTQLRTSKSNELVKV